MLKKIVYKTRKLTGSILIMYLGNFGPIVIHQDSAGSIGPRWRGSEARLTDVGRVELKAASVTSFGLVIRNRQARIPQAVAYTNHLEVIR